MAKSRSSISIKAANPGKKYSLIPVFCSIKLADGQTCQNQGYIGKPRTTGPIHKQQPHLYDYKCELHAQQTPIPNTPTSNNPTIKLNKAQRKTLELLKKAGLV